MTYSVTPNEYSNTTNPTKPVEISTVTATDDPLPPPVLGGWLEFIQSLINNFINPYISAVQKYTAYLKDITDLESFISQKISASGDDKLPVNIDCAAIKDKISALIDKYSIPNPAGSLFTSTATGIDGKNQALKWAAEFGMDPSMVCQTVDGKWAVKVDLSQLTQIFNTFSDRSGNKFDIPTYNQIITAKDAQVQTIKNTMQALTEKYSRAFATMNNITTLFSSTCKSTYDTLSAYLR